MLNGLALNLSMKKQIDSRKVFGQMPEYFQDYSSRVAEHAALLYETAYELGLYSEDEDFNRENIPYLQDSFRLYDIGWAVVPDCFLKPEEALDASEFDVVKRHPLDGFHIICGGPEDVEPEGSNEEARARNLALDAAIGHHERWDGRGYPFSLKGDGIPIAGRICAICDTYDRLVNGRFGSRPMPREFAFAQIIRNKRICFDPELVEVFRNIMERLDPLLVK
ncbi:HD-GYP domain-containing protein [Anaerolentibacter hominis]|uniref:HD-GYP domain-containing protein n=1 Tax=Anaerolentibacter hominis TaxID=3079009 RepID=UPI0031B86BD5